MAESLPACHLKNLSRDLMVNVMSRLDGVSLAAAACTCTELHDVARERGLWQNLCHAIWPSTACPEAKDMVPFDRFYADSRPLILNDVLAWKRGGSELRTDASAADLMSLVDVYHKGRCVLSKVIDGIPMAEYGGRHQKWFADYPFELDVVKLDHDTDAKSEGDGDVSDEEVEDLSMELEDDVRLSWILLNTRLGRSVNVSSWKPLTVQKSWTSRNNYTLKFGCVVPVDRTVLPNGLAECVITATCELIKAEAGDNSIGLKWEEIRMSMRDAAGAHVGWKKTLVVLNQAFYCTRCNNLEQVGKGYQKFEKMNEKMRQSRGCRGTLPNSCCLIVEILIFAALYYTFFL